MPSATRPARGRERDVFSTSSRALVLLSARVRWRSGTRGRAEDAGGVMVTTAGCSLGARHHPCHHGESPFRGLAPQTCLLPLRQEHKIVVRLREARRDPGGGMTVLGSRR